MNRFVLCHQGTELRLPFSGSWLVGRDPACDLCLEDHTVSRFHARLRVAGGEVRLEDAGSQNGVWLADKRLEQPVRLQPGDRFSVGSHEFVLRVLGAGARDTETCRIERSDGAPARGATLPATGQVTGATLPSGTARLGDASRPVAVRFAEALHLVDVLLAAGATTEARRLFGEAIDLLGSPGAAGRLAPLVAARVDACLARWPELAHDPTWADRHRTLRRWAER